jgi:UDP-N-acetylmuramate--alanine ligase
LPAKFEPLRHGKNLVHFIGIGGTGMSGLAKILLELGFSVSGSDLVATPVTKRLETLGATCYIGHEAKNVTNPSLVVVSSAIKPDNPELKTAQKRMLPVIHRSELLAYLMEKQKGIAVAGTHGKTTTTSMLALVLEKNGLDPTVVVGGELSDLGSNAKLGQGEYLVTEADESDGSFLKLKPVASIITNIEDDHLDYYGNISKIKDGFSKFISRTTDTAFVCLDDPQIIEVINNCKLPLVTYAINNQRADYVLKNVHLNPKGSRGEVFYHGHLMGLLELAIPGQHNLLNALAALAAARWVGLDFERVALALRHFLGVGRRFQLLGEVRGIKVVDDYAHHPSEIKATLQAARQIKPQRIISVFQPHRYTRTLFLSEHFGSAFKQSDLVIVSEIYSAGEACLNGVNAQLIVKAILRQGNKEVKYIADKKEIVPYLAGVIRPGDLVITIGAGDIWTVGEALVKKLGEKQHERK